MLTLTKDSHSDQIADAEKILISKSKGYLEDLKKGRDLSEVFLPLAAALANLMALRHFETGKFDPAEYYNNVTPLETSGFYSNSNTLKT